MTRIASLLATTALLAFPAFAEFDAIYGFGTYFVTSTMGGHDIAYPDAPGNDVFSPNWLRAFS